MLHHRIVFRRLSWSAFVCALLVGILAADSQAITITGQRTGSPAMVSHVCPLPVDHLCRDTLYPVVIEHLTGPSPSCMSAVGNYFSDWDVTYNWTQPWNGVLDIVNYQAYDYGVGDAKHDPGCISNPPALLNGMGAFLEAIYTPHTDDPDDPDDPPDDDITRFRWLQIVITSAPAGGLAPYTPYVDPWGNPPEDTLPFYWMEGESPGGDYYFRDYPRRTCPCLAYPAGHVYWQGELYLTDWYTVPGDVEDDNVIIYDGIRWGFHIACTPEPTTLALSALGLVALVLQRRRKRAA